MIEISSADRGMIDHVLQNLRWVDRCEMVAAGTDLKGLASALMRHQLFAYCAWDLDHGPISVWGMILKRQGVGAGFAFGTDDWGKALLPMVRQINGFVLPFLEQIRVHRVEAVALRHREDIRRFMRLIGARPEAILEGYGTEGEDFISYRWLSDEYRRAKYQQSGEARSHATH